MFDFNGMKSDMRSFRRIEPSDGHPVHSVSLSPTGLQFPAPSASAWMPAAFAVQVLACVLLVPLILAVQVSRPLADSVCTGVHVY